MSAKLAPPKKVDDFFSDISFVTPELGVRNFIESFGTEASVLKLIADMNIHCTRSMVSRWKRDNKMPRYVHESMKAVGIVPESSTAVGSKISAVEIYIDGKFAGRVEIPRNVELKLKRRYAP